MDRLTEWTNSADKTLVFGTYRAQPRQAHDAMTFGVDAFRSPDDLRVHHLLIQPFQSAPGQYPINRRKAAWL